MLRELPIPKHDYPLHPGQTHAEPLYCTIPLEEYENLKDEINHLRSLNECMRAELEKRGVIVVPPSAELEGEYRWRRPCYERPPEWNCVIVYFHNEKGEEQYRLAVYSKENGWEVGDEEVYKTADIDAWHPLPNPPKEDT